MSYKNSCVEKGAKVWDILTENEMAHTFYLQLQFNSDIILSRRMIILPTCEDIMNMCNTKTLYGFLNTY